MQPHAILHIDIVASQQQEEATQNRSAGGGTGVCIATDDIHSPQIHLLLRCAGPAEDIIFF